MLSGGTVGGPSDTADHQPTVQTLAPVKTGPVETAASRHDKIRGHAHRARLARADLLEALAHADAAAGPSLGRHRNLTLWWADECKISKTAAGRDIRQSRFLFIDCPEMGAAYRSGTLHEEHIRRFQNLWNKRAIRDDFERDVNDLIEFAHNPWYDLDAILQAWETFADPIDPNEYAARAHTNRSLDTTNPVAQQVLLYFVTTSAVWAQIEPALEAKVGELFNADWAEAQNRVGDAATMDDLLRNNTQRRHDALVMMIRGGIGADPTLANVIANIIVDAETLEEEAENRDAQERGEEPAERDTTDAVARAKRRRCETESGMPLSPADALDYALAAHVRLFINNTKTFDFEASAKTRLFKGPQRIGIMIRDRHCTGAGCDTSAFRCQIDHTIRYTDGGETTPKHGKARCAPCHRHKTRLELLGLWPPGWN